MSRIKLKKKIERKEYPNEKRIGFYCKLLNFRLESSGIYLLYQNVQSLNAHAHAHARDLHSGVMQKKEP